MNNNEFQYILHFERSGDSVAVFERELASDGHEGRKIARTARFNVPADVEEAEFHRLCRVWFLEHFAP